MTKQEQAAWLARFMQATNYPEEARQVFLNLLTAEQPDAPQETCDMLRVMLHMADVYADWLARGWPEASFWHSMQDFRAKLLECRECRGVWGTFVWDWLNGWEGQNRITLGRFCYIANQLQFPYSLSDGRTLPEGAFLLECHIPSDGPALTDETRLDSYRQAWQFFQDKLTDGLLPITCSSWLLYPAQREFLPASSNILRFMDDFAPISSVDNGEHRDGWRIFGRHWGKPYEELPQDTSLRRAYRQRLIDTNLTGRGYGVLVFDGEKIINKKEG